MSLLRVFAQRVALGLVAAWVVLSTVFVLFTQTSDWILQGRVGLLRWGGADEEAVDAFRQEYLAARGLDRPVWVQYLDWMGNMLTGDWGTSFVTGEPAFPMVVDAVSRTALYVLPAIAIGIAAGVLVGLYAAMNPDGKIAEGGLGTAYLLFALPNFWVGGVLLSLAGNEFFGYSELFFEHVLPMGLVATSLLGGYASYTRAHSLEYVPADFVTLVEAKGASRLRVAGHVVRNAAIPLFSMLFTEALALLVLAVFVIEALFGIDGFGLLLFESVRERDLPVILGGTIVIILLGVVGNIVQDVSYSTLDPRVDTGSR